ncbi:DUF4189 domain-containing protein [Xanthomonas arboricola]|uniref:DUF4189 domain-containing protein n=1 Tax=Xanthomonas arboricola TaxID=56448 RepID=UPI000C866F2B|nr:DUF4189 domain-containing protein [Xanthomonas arboricola]PPT19758.1 hypothetical protein XarCFBP6771_13590 [Xanthomonas arboricola]
MRIQVVILSLVLIIFLSPLAHAEGGCPAGQYPIGGQGAITCAPIPQGSVQQKSRPSGKWIKTWGAIAMGSIDSTTSYEVTSGKSSKSEAEQDALRRCASHGEDNCEIALSYENQCAVIAEPQIDGKPLSKGFVRFTGAETVSKASGIALRNCKSENSTTANVECKIVYKNCTEQFFQEF